MVHWANVQTMFLAPTFLVNLVAGPAVGLRLHIVLHFVVGFVGCFVLARRHGIGGLWSVAPGVVYIFGANFAERATGHIGFMPFLLLPWLTYFYDRARTDFRFAIPCGGVLAYAVIAGGPYPFVMFCVYIANGSGAVTLAQWTPNRLELDVDVPASRLVAVNMNYHRDWYAEGGEGANVVAWRGLLAVEVPQGMRRVTLWYRPRRLGPYFALTVAGLIGSIVAWRRLGRRRRQGR